jgi:hypothetical protein
MTIELEVADRPYETVGDAVRAEYREELIAQIKEEIVLRERLIRLIKDTV